MTHPYAIRMFQWDAPGTDFLPVDLDQLVGSPSWIFGYDGAGKVLGQWTIGTGLSITSGVLNCTVSGAPTRSASSPARSLNTAFQAHASRAAEVAYSVKIQTTSTIAGGQEGEVILEYADDSGITTNVVTLGTISNGQTVSLAVALQVIQPLTFQIGGWVPAGKYIRLRTNNVTGSPTYTLRNSREVLE